MFKANYHTHTTRCQHATGNDEEYILSAIKGGWRELGFSDHTPWKYNSPYVSPIRMDVLEYPEYVSSIRELKEKHKEHIQLKLGLECEYFPAYIPWLIEISRKEKLDYLIFGNHFYDTDEKYPYFGRETRTSEMLKMYEESSIRGIESGLFACFAHPDLFMRSYPTFDKRCEVVSRKICRAANKMNIPLEYNIGYMEENIKNGFTGYPHPSFWKIAADEGCVAIIGIDAHDNRMLENSFYYNKAIKEAMDLGIKLIDRIG